MVFHEGTIAVLYSVFAVLFVICNIDAQDTATSSAIYDAVVQRYLDTPFKYAAARQRYLDDIQSPKDLRDWLNTVFATVTFAEQPENGRHNGFCTEGTQCGESEGDCDSDNQCQTNLTCGDTTTMHTGVKVNGETYYDAELIQEICEHQGNPIDLNVVDQACSPTGSPDDDLPPCCILTVMRESDSYTVGLRSSSSGSYASHEPVTRIERYDRADTPEVLSSCPSSMLGSTSCCTPSEPKLPFLNSTQLREAEATKATNTRRVATVSSFNRVLLIRFSIKRFAMMEDALKLETRSSPNGLFKQVVRANKHPLDASAFNGANENTSTFDSSYVSGKVYTYQKDKGYKKAGGYVEYIDPEEGGEHMRAQLMTLDTDNIFNFQLATFALEIIVYNGNRDRFMFISFTFSFDTMGTCKVTQAVSAFNLNLYNLDNPNYQRRVILEFVLVFFVICFYLIEIKKIVEFGFMNHYKTTGAFVDMISLILCTSVLAANFILQSTSLMQDRKILDEFRDPAQWIDAFEALDECAAWFTGINYIVAFNLFVVFLRMVALLASLQSNLGLILKVLNIAMYNIMYFLFMFLMIMLGFVFFAFFTFGTRYVRMSDPAGAFYEVYGMLMGTPIYKELDQADPLFAFIFFYMFYILFYLVMKNMFVSILMTGYDYAVQDIDKPGATVERNPFAKVYREFHADILSYVAVVFYRVWAVINLIREPLWECTKETFNACLPSRNPLESCFDAVRNKCKRRGGDNTAVKGKKAQVAKEDEADAKPLEIILNLVFLFNFVCFMYFQTNGLESYNLTSAALKHMKEASWVASSPMRVNTFESIKSFEEVAEWARHTIVGSNSNDNVKGESLYDDPRCATMGATLDSVPPEVSAQNCDNGKDTEQLVNQVSNWNIGILNTTFVRLTVQPNCYIRNPEPRFKDGYPHLSVVPAGLCAHQDCTSVQKEYTCLTSTGEPVSEWEKTIRQLKLIQPGKLGPAELHGGYALSLGIRAVDANALIDELEEARVFTRNTASMVFDFVTYNGNLDMFVFSRVGFSLDATGDFTVDDLGQAFPLNFGGGPFAMSGGGGENALKRGANVFLFVVYVSLVMFFICKLALDLRKEHKICASRGKPFYYFIFQFYSRVWNISDTLSLSLSVFAIYIFLSYLLLPFRKKYMFSLSTSDKFSIPQDVATEMGMVSVSSPERFLEEDWYIFHEFERCVSIYKLFLNCAALNSFFISIKVVKYTGQIPSVKIFSETLASGLERIFYFTLIIVLLLFGFALFYNILFGVAVTSMSSPGDAFLRLFDWMVGKYDLDPFLKVSPLIALFSFVVFMFLFYFIAVNMYLSAMMNTYSRSVGLTDINKAREKVENERRIRVVEYSDLEQLRSDLKHVKREKAHPDEALKPDIYSTCDVGELPLVRVVELKPASEGGIAAKFGVAKDHIILKINADQEQWRRQRTVDDMFTKGIKENEKDFRIRVTFKDSKKDENQIFGKAALLMGSDNTGGEKDTVTATVKNFWRTQGAVTWVYQQVANAERAEDIEKEEYAGNDAEGPGERGDDEESDVDMGEGDAEVGGDADGDGGASKSARLKCKKKLESLLFSRWPEGKKTSSKPGTVIERGVADGADPPFSGLDASHGGADDGQAEKNMDRDALRDKIEDMMVTGEEAWLDCLITAIERETEDGSIVTEVLRTSDMDTTNTNNRRDPQKDNRGAAQKSFDDQADKVLKILEYKARRKYYQKLEEESKLRQEQLDSQNRVLHEYVWELEGAFTELMASIHSFKAKKQAMLAKLAGLLDKTEYKDVAGVQQHEQPDKQNAVPQHLQRLTRPWPVTRGVGGGRQALPNSSG